MGQKMSSESHHISAFLQRPSKISTPALKLQNLRWKLINLWPPVRFHPQCF